MPELQRLLSRPAGKLRLDRKALATIHFLSWTAYPFETGGVILGRRGFEDALGATVRHVIGPGPAASHAARTFEPDYEWQADEVAAQWEEDPTLQYVGDWHTHPGGTTRLSSIDIEALRTIAAAPDARQPNPVMLLAALHPDRTCLGATVLSSDRLKKLRLVLQPG